MYLRYLMPDCKYPRAMQNFLADQNVQYPPVIAHAYWDKVNVSGYEVALV